MTKRIDTTCFGLIAWLERTKVVLPLKGVECAFNVCGDVVSVEIDQIFEQNTRRPLDCLYTFPLPAGAAIYRCEMHVNGRVIRARVEEQQRARELAAEKKAAGFRTALVEMERDNLFTLSLGNVQPGDLVVIRLAYFQTLTRLGDWTSFRIPFCPGIRYVPGTPLLRSSQGRGAIDDTEQVPDASRISPPRIDRLHPDAAYLTVEGMVEHPLDDLKDLSSPTHPLLVKPGKKSSQVSLADGGAVPDSDFIVRWTELDVEAVKPVGWVTRQQDTTYALVRLRAPVQAEVAENYSQDIYFLIDRSGSMAGIKWEKAVDAFQAFVKGLGQGDRVWATFFESGVRDFAEKPVPVTDVLADIRRVKALGTAGGTELMPALEHVLQKMKQHSEGRPATLLLITDGQVGNEGQILKRLGARTDLRVHVFGIDVTINDGFLQKLAGQHQGTSCLMSPKDDIVGAVSRLAVQLRRPVLTSIHVDGDWELPGGAISDLHAGEVLSLPLIRRVPQTTANDIRPDATTSAIGPISIKGRLPDGSARVYSIDVAETVAAAIPLLWCQRRIDFLLATDNRAAAIELARQSNLVCEGTAFIAWNESEKVPVSSTQMYQPAMDPTDVFAAKYCLAAPAGAFMHRAPGGEALSELTDEDEVGAFYAQDKSEGLFRKLKQAFIRKTSHDVADWRLELERLALFQASPGQLLLDCLADWARSRPTQLSNSVEKLDELLKELAKTANDAERIRCLRQWIERTMETPFKEKALAVLQSLEMEVQAAVRPTG